MTTPAGKAFVTINEDDDGEPLEVFVNVGKAGSDVAAIAEAMGRMISTTLRLRGGVSARKRAVEVAGQLMGIGGRRSVGFGSSRVMSLPDAIGIALATHYGFRQSESNGVLLKNGTSSQSLSVTSPVQQPLPLQAEMKADLCPECGEHSLVMEEGCAKCYSCGHSEC